MYEYIDDILNEKIISGKYVKKACQRHLDLLEQSKSSDFPYYFDESRAQDILLFINGLKHTIGRISGKPFILMPWQVFIVCFIFGWVHKDTGFRMVKTAYIEVARKSGKSMLLSAIALYMLLVGENQAEVYSLATKAEQARRVFNQSKLMVQNNHVLSKYIKIYRDSLLVQHDGSIFKPLASDTKKLDGLNVSCSIFDELHAWSDASLYDIIDTATGSRDQPLIISITTAGVSKETICWTIRKYVINILNGIFDDLSYFGIIYSIDSTKEWENKECWIKANPGLGEINKLSDLERKFTKATNEPSFRGSFKRLHLGLWGEKEENWILPDQWAKCRGTFNVQKPDELNKYINFLKNKYCFAGLDLSSTTDLTALSLVFPPQGDDEYTYVLPYAFIPEDTIQQKSKIDKVSYSTWKEQELLITTEGNVIDYRVIMQKILWCCSFFEVREIDFDAWNSSQLITELQEKNIEVVGIRQGFKTMSPAIKELEKLILGGKLVHANNPILGWCLSNVKLISDPAENVKITKQTRLQKIDLIAATVNAISRIIVVPVSNKQSIYDENELLVL